MGFFFFMYVPMAASSVSSASSASQSESRDDNSSKDPTVDSKSEGTLLVSQPPSDAKTVQLILTQSAAQPVGSSAGRAPVVIASVSPSDQTKKGSLVAKLTQSGSEHLTGGQVAKICASTPQMSNAVVGAGSGKPKAFATMLGGGDSAPPTSSPKKQSSTKRGMILLMITQPN